MQHALVQKPYKGMGMEGPVAKWYTSLTAKAADDFKALAQRVAGEVPPGSDILEVAPGPGYFVIEVESWAPTVSQRSISAILS